MPRASAGSGEGKASPCSAPFRYRDFQDYRNLCSRIPPCRRAKASHGGKEPGARLASPCPGSQGRGERDLAGAAAVGAGSGSEVCGCCRGG